MKKTIYLDHAAATPLDPLVRAAMEPFLEQQFYNPSASYSVARDTKKELDKARAKVAHNLGAKSSEIYFISGGSEANNLAINGILEQYPGSKIVLSAVEHDSVMEPALQYPHTILPVLEDGLIDLSSLESLITDDCTVVSIMYANNEVGTVQPIREVSKVISKVRKKRQAEDNNLPLYFHSDAAQAANYLDLHVSRLGVDLMTLNGGKIYGPKQSGVLFVKSGVELTPQIRGGGQENGLRSGTENVAGCVGFAVALDIAQNMRDSEVRRLHSLQELFFSLVTYHIPSAVINGSKRKRLPSNVHISFPGVDNERLLVNLDEANIYVAVGSACSASKEEPSHVLRAMGISDDLARSSLRFSMGRTTDEATIKTVISQLAKLVNKPIR